jgi:hypothetical protein
MQGVPAKEIYYDVIDKGVLFRIGRDGTAHILARSNEVGWREPGKSQMVYVRRGNDGRLALAVIDEHAQRFSDTRALAIGNDGTVFAAWIAETDRLVGCWIRSIESGYSQ